MTILIWNRDSFVSDNPNIPLGTQTFVRIKVGVGAKPKGWDLADHVLGRFGSNERKLVEEAQERACKAVEMILADSVDAAMNQFNKKMENV